MLKHRTTPNGGERKAIILFSAVLKATSSPIQNNNTMNLTANLHLHIKIKNN